MDSLPNELLEKIISFVNDTKSLGSCRRVAWLWNTVAIKYWQKRYSTRAQLSQEYEIYDFLATTCQRLQEFPYTRIGFNDLQSQNLCAGMHLLERCSEFIEDVSIVISDEKFFENATNISSLLASLAAMALLHELQFKSASYSLAPQIAEPVFTNLRILKFEGPTLFNIWYRLPAMLTLLSVPNLQNLVTTLHINFNEANDGPARNWPFGDEFKRIGVIELKVNILFSSMTLISGLASFTEKLQQWKNIQIVALTLNRCGSFPNSGIADEAKLHMNRLLEIQSNFIESLSIGGGGKGYENSRLDFILPEMPKLNTLEIDYSYTNQLPLAPIIGNPLSNLQKVTLNSFCEPSNVFNLALLSAVKTLNIHEDIRRYSSQWNIENCTNFSIVFPNLEIFTYVNTADPDEEPNFDHIEYLVSTLRMDSIWRLKYELRQVGSEKVYKCRPNMANRNNRINQIFSGFDNLQQIVEGARLAKENESGNESVYWESMEKVRRPCLVNMTGLKLFHFDYAIDDAFAEGILLKMKPLRLLSICLSNVSPKVLQKLTAHHNSVSHLAPI